ncbi:MAG: hypothetical protein A3A33_00105 [Candidatus Yanofskybacteria bacterium RIFCSPLOWO2_01_FULL_49_25]|uniref:LysM domain-containing protein n=1 Tax=Candidatus Yanofskybacteria bacterium RIFCSPLOWO2_01_FULL_49_25 TaxID=1802701 RepID=A0A1F8GUE9_9BACT|nr:MAG: hypothetical protein A3A33_00105 [Candidatus Yanofskybacteria bacterium RIFCSPLOWO2_01_FULL_49_25]
MFSGIVRGYIEETSAYSAIPAVGVDVAEVTTLPPASEKAMTATILQTIGDSFVTPATSIVSSLAESPSDHGNQVIDYEVQEGDTISSIASDFGVSVNAVIWANKIRNINALSPGETLKIPPVTGVIHAVAKGDTVSTIAQKYGAESNEIIAFNILPLSGDLRIGQQIVVPDGIIKSAQKTAGSASTKSAKLAVERFSQLPTLDGYFIIPMRGAKTQGIHGRNGVDWANSIGEPIHAAAEGTVIVSDDSGWNGGYGQYVKISHPNGTETLYGHLSKVLVTAGQYVPQGYVIGKEGTTGRSTGPHLHFEVHGAKNPLAQLKSNK